MIEPFPPVEPALRLNLMTLARAYSRAAGLPLTVVGRRLAGDSKFFVNLDHVERQGGRLGRKGSFTARKYDELVEAFRLAWPEHAEADWPLTRRDPDGEETSSEEGRRRPRQKGRAGAAAPGRDG